MQTWVDALRNSNTTLCISSAQLHSTETLNVCWYYGLTHVYKLCSEAAIDI